MVDTATRSDTHTILPADTNQALGLARYAIEFMTSAEPDDRVLERTNLFHTDAVLCGLSAIALGTNAPNVLRREASRYAISPDAAPEPLGIATRAGVPVFGSAIDVHPEKAIVANCAAVREWDSNGTNFGYNPSLGHTAGEFGHNDFYSVPLAAAQLTGASGHAALLGMICLDEIRGRLAEVFSLKTYKIDHVLHGAIASAAVYGAMLGATPEQIESAIGMTVAHFVPFRAIRAGKQLSDSKGSSAAISTEAAIASVHRSMQGFLGPRDIFRNPEAVFRLFEGPGQMLQPVGMTNPNSSPGDTSPFDLHLAMRGGDFAVMGMHFKIGLYEHQSAGAIQAVITLLNKAPHLLDSPAGDHIKKIRILAYEPAFGIIGDPAKKDPRTRQSADHSMAYIIATVIRKALGARQMGQDATWETLMLGPHDYSSDSIFNQQTRALMQRIVFSHGGPEYDRRYPDGIPTSVVITDADDADFDSGLIMYPAGHARNNTADVRDLLSRKFTMLGGLAFHDPQPVIDRYADLQAKSPEQLASIHDYELKVRGTFE